MTSVAKNFNLLITKGNGEGKFSEGSKRKRVGRREIYVGANYSTNIF